MKKISIIVALKCTALLLLTGIAWSLESKQHLSQATSGVNELNALNNETTIKVSMKVFNIYNEKYGAGELDVHGVSYERDYVVLRPTEKFSDFLRENNFFSGSVEVVKPEMSTEGYLRPEEVLSKLRKLAVDYPNIVRLIDVGRSLEGREILGVEITDDFTIDKPVVSFNGMHHARELMTTEVVISIAEKLPAQYSTDVEVQKFLKDFRIVVVPQVNPDGNHLVYTKDNFWRKNARADSNNRIYGVDLNRNYPTAWRGCRGSSGRRNSQTYRGPSPVSEPETDAMINLFDKYRPVANISYHSYSELIIYPFGCAKIENKAKDVFQSIGEDMKFVIEDDRGRKNTYKVGAAPDVIYEADGTDLDTHWQEFGIISYTIELNSSSQGFQPAYDRWRDITVERQEEGWKQLIRSVSKNAVRFTTNVDLTYQFIDESGKSFAGDDSGHVFYAKAGNLNYRVLMPGKYMLKLYRGKSLVKESPVKIGDDIFDLGTIEIK